MPIYDFNGTTKQEIGKLFDYDGTATHQIGKVYDNNGSANSLVYSGNSPSPALILNGDDEVTAVTGGWTLAKEGGHEYLFGYVSDTGAWEMAFSANNWIGAGWMVTKNAIDVSGYSKLRLNVKTVRGYGDASKTNGMVYVALATTSEYIGGYPDNNNKMGERKGNASAVVKYALQNYGDSGDYFNLDCDVSGIEGSYYVHIGRWDAQASRTFHSYFKSVTFVE